MPNASAAKLYLTQRSASALFFQMVITFELVYHTVVVGLSAWQLVLVGVLLEAMTFIFEVPSGVLADSYSRKKSIVAGFFLMGVGFSLEGLFPTFAAVLAGQVFWGIGFTFTSGATEAWISDEVGADTANRLFLSSTQVAQVSALVGIGLSILLATVNTGLPIFIGGLCYIGLSVFLLLTMTETGFTPRATSRQTIPAALIATVRDSLQLIRFRPVFRVMFATSLVQGMFLGGFDRLWALHFFEILSRSQVPVGDPAVLIGLLSAATMLISIFTVGLARRMDLSREGRVVSLLMLLYAAMGVASLTFAVSAGVALAIVALLVIQTARATLRPVFIGWVNQHATAQVRATVISTYWQSNAIGQIVFVPLVGLVGTLVSIPAALGVGTLVLTLSFPLLWSRRRAR